MPLVERKKGQDRKSSRSMVKNKRGDRRMESNNSQEIPDMRETSDIPDHPSGFAVRTNSSLSSSSIACCSQETTKAWSIAVRTQS